MKSFLIAVCIFFCSFQTVAQVSTLELRLSNNGTGLPIASYPSLFHENFHPGLDIGLKRQFNNSDKHRWLLAANLGVYYHRFVQTGIKLYPSVEYNYIISSKWSAEVAFDAGYILAVNNVSVLELEDDGFYQARPMLKARSQFMVGLRFGIAYKPSGEAGNLTYSLGLGSFFQGPYVSGYVPLLPYNSVYLGVKMPLTIIN